MPQSTACARAAHTYKRFNMHTGRMDTRWSTPQPQRDWQALPSVARPLEGSIGPFRGAPEETTFFDGTALPLPSPAHGKATTQRMAAYIQSARKARTHSTAHTEPRASQPKSCFCAAVISVVLTLYPQSPQPHHQAINRGRTCNLYGAHRRKDTYIISRRLVQARNSTRRLFQRTGFRPSLPHNQTHGHIK